jgi:light-regulated signal transduction histidine kinase (bacteriophytochrome)
VPGDPTLLRQLFMNLIGNALKFRSEQTPRVHISSEAAGELWSITVQDNGIGIDPRYAEKVFAIFSRLHARDQYEGTGIGLALCRKIVEFHGGTIRAVFNENGTTTGATLCFTLPVSVGAIVPAALSTAGES